MNEKAVAKVESKVVQPTQATPESFIAQALATGASLETLEKLMGLQERVNANNARAAFVRAMAGFQSECPVVEKKKGVKSQKTGQIVYYYAPLDSIVEQVSKAIAKHGLAYTFDISSDEKELTATCKVTHVEGHSETFTFKVPIGSESYMTEVQKFGARATFAKRNAFCNAFGIMTGDEDVDGTQTGKDPAPADVRGKISMAVKALGHAPKTADETHALLLKLTGVDTHTKGASMDEVLEKLAILVDDMNSDKSKE